MARSISDYKLLLEMPTRAGLSPEKKRYVRGATGRSGLSILVAFQPEMLGKPGFLETRRVPCVSFDFAMRGTLRDMSAWNEIFQKLGRR